MSSAALKPWPWSLNLLIPLTLLCTLVAAVAGIWPGSGEPFAGRSLRGESVMVHGSGLYYWDTVSSTAQMQANDAVSVVVALLGFVVFFRARQGSLRARLVLAGLTGFILYTYITMVFGASFNALFLVYVTAMSLSLFSLILLLMSFDAEALSAQAGSRVPRRSVAGLLYAAAAFLILSWTGRIAAAWQAGPAPALENVTSLFIQAMDLGLVVPLCILAATLLLRRRPWDILLAAVCMVKFSTLGIAVSFMGLNMARSGVPVGVAELAIFMCMALSGLTLTVWLLARIEANPAPGRATTVEG